MLLFTLTSDFDFNPFKPTLLQENISSIYPWTCLSLSLSYSFNRNCPRTLLLHPKTSAILLPKHKSWPSEPGENEPAVSGFSPQSRSTVALSNSLFWRYKMLEEKAKDSKV